MCGRFQLSVKGKEISERFNTEVFDEHYKPRYNCAPTQQLLVITNNEPHKLNFFHWGLIPHWSTDKSKAVGMINSRAESIASKPAFRDAFQRRRCLVPANGFFEWKTGKVKLPYRFYLKDESLFAMAGIWESWTAPDGQVLHSFSIVTTSANELMNDIHHRMPVILRQKDEEKWLGTSDPMQLEDMLKPLPAQWMARYPVSTKINYAGNDDASLICEVEKFPSDLFDQP